MKAKMMKSTLAGSRFVLAVKDLVASANFYKDKLGFSTLWADGGWHFLIRDNFKIMLGECPDEKAASEIGDHSYVGYLEVENIDELYHEYKQRGITFLGEIENKPWGQREFAIRTVDGHRFTFGEEIK